MRKQKNVSDKICDWLYNKRYTTTCPVRNLVCKIGKLKLNVKLTECSENIPWMYKHFKQKNTRDLLKSNVA